VRGREWHGAFYSYHPDETPYAAYVNSLINGRPRRNDPYSGRIDAALPESLLSIQFVPAYSLALPARVLQVPAMTMFMLLTPLVAAVSVLAIFWLVMLVTSDTRVAATVALLVVCLGALARGQWFVRNLGGMATPYIYLPFLRRYEPAFAFPLLFIFCALVWLMLRSRERRHFMLSLVAAAVAFSALVFSYYFLWTAAAAFIVSVVLATVIVRPETWRMDLRRLAQLGALMIPAVLVYALLLSRRATSMDAQQALTLTHAPDLLRPPALLCGAVLLIFMVGLWRGGISRRDPRVVFITALALAPLIMFNQQVLTGRSLQPIHYEQFIANYVSLVVVGLAAVTIWRRQDLQRKIPTLLLILISLVSLARASQEAWLAGRRGLTFSTIVDESRPAALRLVELSVSDAMDRSTVLVLSPTSFWVSDTLCMTAPQPVLWGAHMFSFSALSPAENKERFYQQMYYSGVEQQTLGATTIEQTYFRLANFGWERVIQGLNANWRPITDAEEQAALAEYQKYVDTFDQKHAAQPTLGYVIAPANLTTDFSRVDRFYERDAGERVGAYVIYRVKRRP